MFSPDGRTIYLGSNRERDLIAFARVRLGKNGEPGAVEVIAGRGDAELGGFDINKQGTAAALMWNVAGKSELAFVDLKSGKVSAGPTFPGEIAGGAKYSPDGRKLAKRAPDDVRQVITLGSPFTGPRRASNTWRLYEWLSGDRAEEPPRYDLAQAPPVPTTCIFTRSDGIVAWQCCVERPGVQAENIEVEGSHFGLGHNPLVLYAIADRLAQPAGQWKPFQRNGVRRLFYRDPARP